MQMREIFPSCRVLSALLKESGFRDSRPDINATKHVAEFKVVVQRENQKFMQIDSHSCEPFCLKYVERILSRDIICKGAQGRIHEYRQHISHSIYRLNIDESTFVSEPDS